MATIGASMGRKKLDQHRCEGIYRNFFFIVLNFFLIEFTFFPRNYYKCSKFKDRNCEARKTVNFFEHNLKDLKIVYHGSHNHIYRPAGKPEIQRHARDLNGVDEILSGVYSRRNPPVLDEWAQRTNSTVTGQQGTQLGLLRNQNISALSRTLSNNISQMAENISQSLGYVSPNVSPLVEQNLRRSLSRTLSRGLSQRLSRAGSLIAEMASQIPDLPSPLEQSNVEAMRNRLFTQQSIESVNSTEINRQHSDNQLQRLLQQFSESTNNLVPKPQSDEDLIRSYLNPSTALESISVSELESVQTPTDLVSNERPRKSSLVANRVRFEENSTSLLAPLPSNSSHYSSRFQNRTENRPPSSSALCPFPSERPKFAKTPVGTFVVLPKED